MLLSDTRIAVQSDAGYFELTDYVTDYEGTAAVNFASRTLMGAKHMWKQPTTTYYDGNVQGYVLSDGEIRFSNIFNADERPLWMIYYPNDAVDVFHGYVGEDSITDDDGAQVMDIPLESSGGFLTTLTSNVEDNTRSPTTPLSLPRDYMLFYWITSDLVTDDASTTELDIMVEDLDASNNQVALLDDVPFVAGLYLVSLGLNADVANARLHFDLTLGAGTRADGSQIIWGYAPLK